MVWLERSTADSGSEGQMTAITQARFPSDAKARKAIPVATGCVDYFPDALAAVAELSRIGNDQHNPGQPLHWDRSKSTDEADSSMRHFVDRGTVDSDGVRHSAKVAWRALALLQKEIEKERTAQTEAVLRGRQALVAVLVALADVGAVPLAIPFGRIEDLVAFVAQSCSRSAERREVELSRFLAWGRRRRFSRDALLGKMSYSYFHT